MTWRRSIVQAEVGQSESGTDEEFEDSRDNLAPGSQIKPPSSVPISIPGPVEVDMLLVPDIPSNSNLTISGGVPTGAE